MKIKQAQASCHTLGVRIFNNIPYCQEKGHEKSIPPSDGLEIVENC